MRLRNDPNAYVKLEESNFLITKFPFSIKGKTVIEVGMGKGEMITSMAKDNPDITYIGIEKFATVAARSAKKALELKLKNFYIICDDVVNLTSLLKGKVETIWLTFSDPWPKARHEKRRLTFKKYLSIYESILDKEGVIKFKTDNDKLFEYSVSSMEEFGFNLKNITRDYHKHPSSENNYLTGYEIKWSQKQKNINYLEARKK